MNLQFAAIHYRVIRDRVRDLAPAIDEQTLANTVEGLTYLHEIIHAVIRSALADEALSRGLKSRIAEMEDRLDRLQDRASKRRQIAKDVMVELDVKKISAPDFTVSIRAGMPALMVIDEAAVPKTYWEPSPPRLKRQDRKKRPDHRRPAPAPQQRPPAFRRFSSLPDLRATAGRRSSRSVRTAAGHEPKGQR